jgi:hypothetical protein
MMLVTVLLGFAPRPAGAARLRVVATTVGLGRSLSGGAMPWRSPV